MEGTDFILQALHKEERIQRDPMCLSCIIPNSPGISRDPGIT